MNTLSILMSAFVLSLVGLGFFIWSQRSRLLSRTADGGEAIFARGARLDTEKPGTGLGLAIVRDVAEIYGGNVGLEESEDLGGLLVRLSLPSADAAITAAP